MFKIVLFLACVVACSAHAVLPLVHTPVVAPIVAAAPYVHGYSGHGYGGHGYGGHGYGHGLIGYGGHGLAGNGGLLGHGHHILKRSPHYTSVGHLGGLGHFGSIGHEVPVAAVAPVAVSHQSRVDVHHSPAVVTAPILPVVKQVVAPVLAAPLAYGHGHYGAGLYGAGHYGGGHYGAGNYGYGAGDLGHY